VSHFSERPHHNWVNGITAIHDLRQPLNANRPPSAHLHPSRCVLTTTPSAARRSTLARCVPNPVVVFWEEFVCEGTTASRIRHLHFDISNTVTIVALRYYRIAAHEFRPPISSCQRLTFDFQCYRASCSSVATARSSASPPESPSLFSSSARTPAASHGLFSSVASTARVSLRSVAPPFFDYCYIVWWDNRSI
jgi:hypothetical protein